MGTFLRERAQDTDSARDPLQRVQIAHAARPRRPTWLGHMTRRRSLRTCVTPATWPRSCPPS